MYGSKLSPAALFIFWGRLFAFIDCYWKSQNKQNPTGVEGLTFTKQSSYSTIILIPSSWSYIDVFLKKYTLPTLHVA